MLHTTPPPLCFCEVYGRFYLLSSPFRCTASTARRADRDVHDFTAGSSSDHRNSRIDVRIRVSGGNFRPFLTIAGGDHHDGTPQPDYAGNCSRPTTLTEPMPAERLLPQTRENTAAVSGMGGDFHCHGHATDRRRLSPASPAGSLARHRLYRCGLHHGRLPVACVSGCGLSLWRSPPAIVRRSRGSCHPTRDPVRLCRLSVGSR